MLYKWVALRARNCTHPLLVLRPSSSSSSWAVVAETVPKSYRVRAAKLVPRLETSFSIRDGGIVTRGGDRRVAIAPADLMTFLVTKKKVDIPPQVLAEVFSEVQTITTSLPLSENSKTIMEQSAVFASSETALQRLKAKAKPRSSKVYEIAAVMNLKDDVNKSLLNEEDRTDDDSLQTNKDNDFTKTYRKSNTQLKSLFGTVNGSPTIDQALYLSKRKCPPVRVQHKSLNPKRAVKIKEKLFVPINKVKKLESEVEMKSSWIYRKEETGTNFDELHPPASQINMNRTGYLFLFL